MAFHTLKMLVAVAALLTSGCMDDSGGGGILPPPPSGAVAVVSNASPTGAFIRRASGEQVPARSGVPLYVGDAFSTTVNATMNLRILRGVPGTIDVSPNTDPLFVDAACFGLSFFHRGTLRIVGHDICVQSDGGSYTFLQNSDVIYSVLQPGVMRVIVREGRVTVIGRPDLFWTTGQSFTVRGREIVNDRRVPPRPIIGRQPPAPVIQ